MSTTIEKIREQSQAEEAEPERVRIEEQHKAVLVQKQREAQRKEEYLSKLRSDIKKFEEQVQQAQEALASAKSNLYSAKRSLEMILNPPPPKPPKDYSKCSCTGGNSFYDQELCKCNYCYDYDSR